MALSRDRVPKDDDFCNDMRREILEVESQVNRIKETIEQIDKAIADAINVLLQTRTELGGTKDPQSRRRLRSKVQRVEEIRDQLQHNLRENRKILKESISQLKQFQSIAASRGC